MYSSITFFFFYLEHSSLVGCSSCPHQDRPVVEKLSRSYGVGPQTLEAQCGTYFGQVRGVVKVCGRVGMKVKDEMRVRFC